MALKPGALYKFPWEDMGTFKYLLFVPFAATVALGMDDADNWSCHHMLVIAAMRYVHSQFWISLSRIHYVTQNTKIQDKGIDFKQVDREDHWDDFIILQAIIMTLVHKFWPGFHSFPAANGAGLWQLLLLHAGPTEFVYYWLHRALHHHTLYRAYHSHHHASFVTEPITGSVHPFMEHLMYTANFAIPPWARGRLVAHPSPCSTPTSSASICSTTSATATSSSSRRGS